MKLAALVLAFSVVGCVTLPPPCPPACQPEQNGACLCPEGITP